MSPAAAYHPAQMVAHVAAAQPAPAPASKMALVSTRALHIPPAILAIASKPKGEATPTIKMLLADVLDLHKFGGHVFARDEYFADRIGVSIRAIGDALKWLSDRGYLIREFDHTARNKRNLRPGPAALALFEKSLQNLQGLPETPGRFCINSLQILQGVVAESADINTTLNTIGKRVVRIKKKGGQNAGSLLEQEEAENCTPPAGSAAQASRTGGPRNFEHVDELPARAHAFDEALPPDRFGKYREVPKSAEMVNEYLELIKHPKAGKGDLFYNYYASRGWRIGKSGMPCMNWVSLIPGFKFYELPEQEVKPAGRGYGQAQGSQVAKRMSAAEQAVHDIMNGN